MARGLIPYIVVKTNGDPAVGASAQINIRGGGSATVYTTEGGATTTGNPVSTDAEGRIVGWLDEGSYDITVSGSGISTVSRGLDIIKGGGTFAEADGSVTTNKIAASAVTNPKMGVGSVLTNNIIDGAVTADKLADAAKLGLSGASVVRRGKSIISASGTRTNPAPGQLSNGPDRVSSVVLPTDGIILVWFQAVWKQSVASTAHAYLYLSSNPVVAANHAGATPGTGNSEAWIGTTANADVALHSWGGGLLSSNSNPMVAYSGDVTTGQIIGSSVSNGYYGPCWIFAAAGTYNVEVNFWADSGTVTVKDRRLWVATIGF